MVNDGIASTIHVPFNIKLPDAPAGAIRTVDANDVLTVLHCLSDVEDELLQRGCLVGALGAGEIGAVVLEGLNSGNHYWSRFIVFLISCVISMRTTAEWNSRMASERFL